MRKPWSIHKRNGIYQTQLYDYKNERYRTAKSTGTKDQNEADLIAYRWAMEFDSGLAAEYTQWAKNVSVIETFHEKRPLTTEIAALVQEACRDAVDKALQRIPYSEQAPQCSLAPDYADVPEEVWPLLDRLQTLTFSEYILLYSCGGFNTPTLAS